MQLQMQDEAVGVGPRQLRGRWAWEPGSPGVVIVLQPTSRLGPAGVAVVSVLRERRASWLRLALLGRGENAFAHGSTETEQLAERVLEGIAWVRSRSYTGNLRIGLFGEGHAAGVAMHVATRHPSIVSALVLCSGQFDLAVTDVARTEAPSLLIAAGLDGPVVENNRLVLSRLRCVRRLEIVPNAMRRLSQPGALDTVAHLTAGWCASHLRSGLRP